MPTNPVCQCGSHLWDHSRLTSLGYPLFRLSQVLSSLILRSRSPSPSAPSTPRRDNASRRPGHPLIAPYVSRLPAVPEDDTLPTVSLASARSHASSTRHRSAVRMGRAIASGSASASTSAPSSISSHPARVRRHGRRHPWRGQTNIRQGDFRTTPSDTSHVLHAQIAILPHHVCSRHYALVL
jgi:hypothetical protein